jgi:hypothetical protein
VTISPTPDDGLRRQHGGCQEAQDSHQACASGHARHHTTGKSLASAFLSSYDIIDLQEVPLGACNEAKCSPEVRLA